MSWGSHILVGYDGTTDGERALRWAATEAKIRKLPLSVCHAWRWPYPIAYIDHEGAVIVRKMGRHVLDHGVARAREIAPTVTVKGHLADGPADSALLHLAESAEMIVVGAHERTEMPLGSTALRLPARADRPVVVVRPDHHGHRSVVAGFDGSAGAEAALAFAFEEAAVRRWSLHVVSGCWEPNAAAPEDLGLYADEQRLRRVRGARLEQSVAPWCTKYPQVETRTSLLVTSPREALLEAARTADLIVVGRRGAGGRDGLRVGATTSAMLQQSPCAVAVVPPRAGL
ncbi:universal stress protein [Actinomadura gamaensis]|uniref:Universal stress protein n=1 Tax=Actinomadura gamaensis TaxID=1763541 RepID=A0ABV9TWA6_9ACTN